MSFTGNLTSTLHPRHAGGSSLAWETIALLRLAFPIMLIALVNMGMSVTDAAMVTALYGADALAAVSIGSDIYSIVFYLGAGVVGGVAPFYAAAAAQNDFREKARLRRIGWSIVGGVAMLVLPVIWTAPDWLAMAGLDMSLLDSGRGYTRAMALTVAPMLGVTLFRTLLTSAAKPRLFLQVTLAMLPLNAAANYLLMTGWGFIPAFGPTGAGISSFIVASATLGVLGVLHRDREQPHQPNRILPSWPEVAAVLRVGVPIGIATVGEVGIFLAATLYAARLGAADVAAHTLALRTAGIAYAIPAALLQASLVRMARAESTSDDKSCKSVMKSSLALSLLTGVILCVIIALAAAPLGTYFFEASPTGIAAAALASQLLSLLAAMEVFGNPGAAAAGLLRGQKEARAPMTFNLLGHWGVGAPIGIVLCELYDFGIIGVWLGLLTGTALASTLSVSRLVLPHVFFCRQKNNS
jgi:MATE family multidrug resistance protein